MRPLSERMAVLSDDLREWLRTFGPATTTELHADFADYRYPDIYRMLTRMHRLGQVSRLAPMGGGAILWWIEGVDGG